MLPSIASKCTGVEGVEQGFTPVDSVFTALLYSIFTMSSFYRFTTVPALPFLRTIVRREMDCFPTKKNPAAF
jgi:hypothetical protein